MVRKKVDSRVRTLIENGVKLRHRSFFVIVGDKGRDQVVNLHYILSKSVMKTRPSVLWCYEKELGFTSNRVKRAKNIKRDVKRGIRTAGEENPFELFVSATDIRYTYYKETHKILGNTFGMCVLQDFHALTPNLLARTIETVEGGGIVVLLLKTMRSLKQLYTMTMDVHARYRTESHHDVVGRFNERFLLSLASNTRCLVLDDELNVLPISSHIRNIKKVELGDVEMDEKGEHIVSQSERELKDLKNAMHDTQPIGSLVNAARTLDQAKAVLTFVEAIQEKTLRSTVALTAARGRGKSAALGIAIAGAVAYGYANIFVTAPSPENVKTLFEMILKGFDALNYKEHMDYDVVQSTNPDFNKAIIRINVFREHRQTIQYILPQDHMRLGQAELLVVDEAAAIPLPIMKSLLGNYLVFLSSTVNGYEGTGRSLSLKLIADLRRQSVSTSSSSSSSATATNARTLREIEMEEPIRYGAGDPVEQWLNALLCLDCNSYLPRLVHGIPHPSMCDLYYVNKDTLFSYHKGTEVFLQKLMALFVSSHYKNTPNDLQLMSDGPAHHIFVLLAPVKEEGKLPDILVAMQVALEGGISAESSRQSLARGQLKAGDLIPWSVCTQFQDSAFASLSGARVIRVAVHPELQRMGYGSRAVELLTSYYDRKLTKLADDDDNRHHHHHEQKTPVGSVDDADDATTTTTLQTEVIAPRKTVGHLLEKLDEREPEALDYVGVSYGMTVSLFNFWRRLQFSPVYVRQTANDLTGEHSCIMLRTLSVQSPLVPRDWLSIYGADFQRRFISLLPISFRQFSTELALSVTTSVTLTPATTAATVPLTFNEVRMVFTEMDLRRLESYARNLVDYHMIMDLVPSMARLVFTQRVDITLSHVQSAILVAVGLQCKSITDIERELDIPSHQLLALFNKMVRKVSTFLRSVEENAVKKRMIEDETVVAADADDGTTTTTTTTTPKTKRRRKGNKLAEPLTEVLDEEMKEGGRDALRELARKNKAVNEIDVEALAAKFGGGGGGGDDDDDQGELLVTSSAKKPKKKKHKQKKRKST